MAPTNILAKLLLLIDYLTHISIELLYRILLYCADITIKFCHLIVYIIYKFFVFIREYISFCLIRLNTITLENHVPGHYYSSKYRHYQPQNKNTFRQSSQPPINRSRVHLHRKRRSVPIRINQQAPYIV